MDPVSSQPLRCLLAIDDALARDAIAQAVASFEAVECDAKDLAHGRDQLRRRTYDLAFVALKSVSKDSKQLLDEIRETSPGALVIGVTPATALESKKQERAENALFALLGVPLDVVQTFSTLRRAIDRITKSRLDRNSAPRT